MTSPAPPLSLFYSYAHRDEALRDELETHLTLMKRQGLIQLWHDRCIMPGEEWAGEIDDNLESADIILLLISPDFIASDYCYEREMRRAMERHQTKEARVIPIFLRPTDHVDAPFIKLQGLPLNIQPVTQWSDRDAAFVNIAQGIRQVVAQIQAQKVQALQEVKNPFLPLSGMVDDPELFFGRDRELERIFELINSQCSVAVIGEREVGKSSLLRAIFRQAEMRLRTPRKPIYLNLHMIESDEDFYSELCEKAEIPSSRGAMLARSLRSKRVLLLLDEVEKMTWQGFTNGVRSQLRGLAEGADAPLRLVLAAGISLDRLFPDGQMDVSPLKGICIEERLERWTESEMRKLIKQRLTKTPIRFTEQEIHQLVQDSDGSPKQFSQLCYRLFQNYREGQR